MKKAYLKVVTATEVLVEGVVDTATVTSSHVSWDSGENTHAVALTSVTQLELTWPAP